MNKQNSLGSGSLKLQTGKTDSQSTMYYSSSRKRRRIIDNVGIHKMCLVSSFSSNSEYISNRKRPIF